MNQAKLQTSSEGYSIATVGDIASFEGKAFVKDILDTTSMEVSFGTLAPGCTVPFFHHHKQNEEVYVVLSGEGVFILDGKEKPVASGSIVRVVPSVSRNTEYTLTPRAHSFMAACRPMVDWAIDNFAAIMKDRVKTSARR